MAAVNFPDPSASPWYNPDNGVTYEYNAGVWSALKNPNSSLDDTYVEVAGDTMTGPLSINNEITLNTDGSAVFSNDVTAGVIGSSPRVQLNASSAYVRALRADGKQALLSGSDTYGFSLSESGDIKVSISWDGDVQMASQNSGPLAGFRNQIINGDFRIWQRGTTVSVNDTVATYGADRWKANAGTRDFRRSDKAVSATNAPDGFAFSGLLLANTSNQVISQAVELDNADDPGMFAVGTTWTFSFYARGAGLSPTFSPRFRDGNTSNTGSNTRLDSSQPAVELIEGTGGDTWSRYRCTFTVDGAPGGGTNPDLCVDCQINFSMQNTVRFTGVQLEPGPVATPFEHRPIGTELALCQRYFQRATASSIIFNVGSTGTNTARGTIPLATSMRRSTGTLYNADQIVFIDRPGGTESACDINAIAYCDRGIRLQFDRVTSAADTYKIIFKMRNSTTGADSDTISIDTEL